jgi:NADH-quinone oxidoreductase subunit J
MRHVPHLVLSLRSDHIILRMSAVVAGVTNGLYAPALGEPPRPRLIHTHEMQPIHFYAACAVAAAALYALMRPKGRAIRAGATIVGFAAVAWMLATVASALPGPTGRFALIGLCAFVGVSGAVRLVTHPKPIYAALYFVLVIVSSAVLYVLLDADFVAFSMIIVYAGAILITYMFVLMLAQQASMEAGVAGEPEYDRLPREPATAVIAGFVLLAVLGTASMRGAATPDAARTEWNAVESRWRDLESMPKLLLERAKDVNPAVQAVVAGDSGRAVSVRSDGSAVVTVRVDGQEAPQPLTLTAEALPENSRTLGLALVGQFPASLELAAVILLMAMLGAVVLARRQGDLAEDERRGLAGLSRLVDGGESRR